MHSIRQTATVTLCITNTHDVQVDGLVPSRHWRNVGSQELGVQTSGRQGASPDLVVDGHVQERQHVHRHRGRVVVRLPPAVRLCAAHPQRPAARLRAAPAPELPPVLMPQP